MRRVAIIGENSIEYVDTLINIWNCGDCAVLIDWRIPFFTAVAMMREANVKQCFIEERLADKENIRTVSDIEFVAFEHENNTAQCLPRAIYDRFNESYSKNEAVVIYSSGTTGKSKGIILSHFAINTNADAIIDYMGLENDDCIYIARTLSHSSTLTGELLVALKTRTKLVIAPVIVPPRVVFNNIEKHNVSIIGINPTLLNMYAEEVSRNEHILTSLKTIYVSGSVLNDKVYTKAHDVFKNINIYNVYGLSEAGPRLTAQTKVCCKENSVGKPIKGVDVAIVNDAGECVRNSERGIIHVNTMSLYSGYVVGAEKNKSLYKGWLNTGDIGYFSEHGELHIVDRADDVIICNSHKVYPRDVEELILKDLQILDCAVSRCMWRGSETIGCLYVSDKDCAIDIVHRLKNKLSKYEMPKKFERIEEIPHNCRGKVDYKKVYELLSDDSRKEDKAWKEAK